MTRSDSENAVSFKGMKHLNTAEITATYGVLLVRAAVAIAVFMAVLVFVGGANAGDCSRSQSAEATTEEVKSTDNKKAEVEA